MVKKSAKQRRQEIRADRLRKAQKASAGMQRSGLFPWEAAEARPPVGAIAADHQQLDHNNTYGPLPAFYVDLAFVCAGCGSDELWTAKQQKWWYEIAKGDINSTAKYCRQCRNLRRQQRNSARAEHIRGLIAKRGISKAAELLQKPEAEIEHYSNEAGGEV
ncbi:MAG: zinc-ribbon domain containing protein [Rhizobiaceae bacterium]